MTGLWEHNPWYSILRPYVDTCTKYSYARTEIHGKGNIPVDGAVIFAPNHCGALMDALVMLRCRRDPTVFGARADIFENRTVASILNFLRILPMVRKRDGIRKVIRNYETIQSVTDVLTNGVPFCIFSEGTHRTKHSLMPVTKGIYRIAMAAIEQSGTKPVYIVPVGLEYEDYFHYRKTALVNFGKAINMTEFIRARESVGNTGRFLEFRDLLGERLSELITFIPDDEQYESRWAAVKEASIPSHGSLYKAMQERRRMVADIIAGKEIEKKRRSGGKLAKVLLAILTSPAFAASALLTLPMWLTAELLAGKMKDKAFTNSVRFCCKLVGTILMGVIWAAVFFCTMPWYAALAILVYFIHSYSIFYDWLNLINE